MLRVRAPLVIAPLFVCVVAIVAGIAQSILFGIPVFGFTLGLISGVLATVVAYWGFGR
jgi:hypothetical protein